MRVCMMLWYLFLFAIKSEILVKEIKMNIQAENLMSKSTLSAALQSYVSFWTISARNTTKTSRKSALFTSKPPKSAADVDFFLKTISFHCFSPPPCASWRGAVSNSAVIRSNWPIVCAASRPSCHFLAQRATGKDIKKGMNLYIGPAGPLHRADASLNAYGLFEQSTHI